MAKTSFTPIGWIHVIAYGMLLLNAHGLENLAKEAHAWQSSKVVEAGKAVDGISDANFHHGSCSSTTKEAYPWWIVDLGTISQVEYVTLLTRNDCCSDRTLSFTIEMSSELTADGVALKNPSRCFTYYSGQLVPGSPKTFSCPATVYARYVKIQLQLTNETLVLCEVEVYGTRSAPFYDQCPKRFKHVSGKLPSSMILDTVESAASVIQCVFRCCRTKNCHSMNVLQNTNGVFRCELLEDVGNFGNVAYQESWEFYNVT